MRDTDLFGMALAIASPWAVRRSDFDAAAKRLDIHLDFARGSRFACPSCGAAGCPAYDSEDKTWAASELLSARSLSACAPAAGDLQGMRNQASRGALGAAGQRLYAAV